VKELLKTLSLGIVPTVVRYYTLIPYEDDSRHRAYLDAVEDAGFQVVVKRLPPKGVNRQVLVDTEMASDIVAFAFGYNNFSLINDLDAKGELIRNLTLDNKLDNKLNNKNASLTDSSVKKVINLVCPSKELTYAISLANTQNTETITADFGKIKANQDILKSASKWIDLSDSETIWR
jgi:hypothetical protein